MKLRGTKPLDLKKLRKWYKKKAVDKKTVFS